MELSNGSDNALINISIESNIYGFLIVYPITFNASVEFYLILGWVSLKHAERVGTIFGRHTCNCFGAQCAIFPNAQI